jgi:hypothetical protein
MCCGHRLVGGAAQRAKGSRQLLLQGLELRHVRIYQYQQGMPVWWRLLFTYDKPVVSACTQLDKAGTWADGRVERFACEGCLDQ